MPTHTGPAWDGRLASVDTLEALARAGAYNRHWYREAREDITTVAEDIGVSPGYFADVLAVTSPRVHVSRNVTLAVAAVRGTLHTAGALAATRRAYLTYQATGRINGPKTRAFADALRGDETAVVLDVWMARAFAVSKALQRDPERVQALAFSRKESRAECIRRVEAVAARLGWTPAQTQAAIWAGAYTRHYPGVDRAPAFNIARHYASLV